MVATSEITHATPASFIAHQTDRNQYEAIAEDFLQTRKLTFSSAEGKNILPTAKTTATSLLNSGD